MNQISKATDIQYKTQLRYGMYFNI